MTSVLMEGKFGHREKYWGKIIGRHKEKLAIYKPRREAWNRFFDSSKKEQTLLTPWSWTPELLDNKLLLFIPPNLWYFVMAALTNIIHKRINLFQEPSPPFTSITLSLAITLLDLPFIFVSLAGNYREMLTFSQCWHHVKPLSAPGRYSLLQTRTFSSVTEPNTKQ